MTDPVAISVDFHTHVISPDLPQLAHRYPYPRWPSVRRNDDKSAEIYVGDRFFRAIDDRCWSIPRRLDDMRREGVDMQVLSVTPITLSYRAPSDGAIILAQAQNDFLAELVGAAPDHFRALGTIPLQDPPAAVSELTRCVTELGFLGVEVGSNIAGDELSDERFEDFLGSAERLGALIFIHPDEILAAPRLIPNDLRFGLGIPGETATAAASLLMSGAFDRWPNLRVCLAHGGGALPGILPRIDRGWQMARDRRTAVAKRTPSDYARNMFCDSLTYEPRSLALAIARFGEGHVMLGTDYPFVAREDPPGKVLDPDGSIIASEMADAIRGSNALTLISAIEDSRAATGRLIQT